MPIDLGLTRVVKLLQYINNPHQCFKSIHIAGTNGKGSTIAYLSSILSSSSITNGKFTSPHLKYYNDCIAINNKIYPFQKFNEINKQVLQLNQKYHVGCTEFELLAVTAFKIFEIEKVQLAIIEVGVGGRLDATNVLEPLNQESGQGVIATGITKIGMDHENLLGSTLGEIAFEKAGIIKPNTPCVVDNTNEADVIETIKECAPANNAPLYLVDDDAKDLIELSPLAGDYQLQNLSIAVKIISLISKYFPNKITEDSIAKGIASAEWPGRLQKLVVPKSNLSILLDGAHNESAAIELGKYLNSYRDNKGLIFIIAMTQGKSVENLLKHIVNKETDTIIATDFTPPENMLWVKSYPIKQLQLQAEKFAPIDPLVESDITKVFEHVSQYRNKGDDRKVVVCGSLYLCGDVLRLVSEE